MNTQKYLITAAADYAAKHMGLSTVTDGPSTEVIIDRSSIRTITTALAEMVQNNETPILSGNWMAGTKGINECLSALSFTHNLALSLEELHVRPCSAFNLGVLIHTLHPVTTFLPNTDAVIRVRIDTKYPEFFAPGQSSFDDEDPENLGGTMRLYNAMYATHHRAGLPVSMTERIPVAVELLHNLSRSDIRHLRDCPGAFSLLRRLEVKKGAYEPWYADILSVLVHDEAFNAK